MCKIIGVGTDLCSIDRMERATQKEHFTARVFTEEERAYLDKKGKQRAASAAAMFAAKEAVAKALGTGFAQGVMPWTISVAHDVLGAPHVLLLDAALTRFDALGGKAVFLSLSHEGNTAMAFAVIQG